MFTKDKAVRGGPATRLETSPGIGTDPLIITSFRAVGTSPMELVSLQYTFGKLTVGPHFSHVKTQPKAIILITFYIARAFDSL